MPSLERSGASAWLDSQLESLIASLEAAWQGGRAPALAEYVEELRNWPSADREKVFEELVAVDLEYQWRHNGAGTDDTRNDAEHCRLFVHDYAALLPGWSPSLGLITEEYLVRWRWGDHPTVESYFHRFPKLQSRLATMLRLPGEASQRVERSDDTQLSPSHESVDLVATSASVAPQKLDRFEIRDLVGEGAFGRVYRAWDPTLHREVALKTTKVEGNPHAGLESLLHEARLAASIQHPALVHIYDVLPWRLGWMVVMEFIRGRTLKEVIAGGRVDARTAARWVAALAEALHAAHVRSLVHRDVKPGNVILDEEEKPHLTDFGLALRVDARQARKEVTGTPAYMSPEQVRGNSQWIDGRSDLWSLGAVMYELICGQRAFSGSQTSEVLQRIVEEDPAPPRRVNAGVPEELERICLKCLRKPMTDRYATGQELAADLQRWLATQSGSTESLRGSQPLAKSQSRDSLGSTIRPGGSAPVRRDAFIGRARERQMLTGFLRSPEVSVVTLVGPPGIGKSRLAMQVANDLKIAKDREIHWVDASASSEWEAVAAAIATSLGQAPGAAAQDVIPQRLCQRGPTLLVLDNFDRAVRDGAPVLQQWCEVAANLTVLVTSREPLCISGEQQVELGPLELPVENSGSAWDASESVQLFVRRATQVDPSLRCDTPACQSAVQAICRRVEGIPLAIELAASQVKAWRPETLVQRLQQGWDALNVSRRQGDERHATLQSAVAWSFDHLMAAEQDVLTQLAGFENGFTLEAAEATIELKGGSHQRVADIVGALRDKSLIAVTETNSRRRFYLLGPIRDYCRSRTGAKRSDKPRTRRAEYLISFAEHESRRIRSVDGEVALRRLSEEFANILAVADEAAAARDGRLAARAVLSIAEALEVRATPGFRIARLLGCVEGASEAQRVPLLLALARSYYSTGEWHLAESHAQEAQELAQQSKDLLGVAESLRILGRLHAARGEQTSAIKALQHSLKLFTDQHFAPGRVASLLELAFLHERQGELDEAMASLETADREARAIADASSEASLLRLRGNILSRRGEHQGALACFDRAASIAVARNDERLHYLTLIGRGISLIELGQLEEAAACYRQAEQLARHSCDVRGVAVCRSNQGLICVDRGEYEQALEHFAAAECTNHELENAAGVALNLGNAGYALSCLGRHEEGITKLREAVRLHLEHGRQLQAALSQGDLGTALLRSGQPEQGRVELAAANKELDRLSAPQDLARFNLLAELAQATAKCRDSSATSIAEAAQKLWQALNLADHPQRRAAENREQLQRLEQSWVQN